MTKKVFVENPEIPQQSRNKVTFMWIFTVFFGVVPGFLLYRIYKHDPYLQEQAKDALNWSITILIAILSAILLSFFVGSLLIPLVGVIHFVFCLKAALAAWLDEAYRVPLAFRLVK